MKSGGAGEATGAGVADGRGMGGGAAADAAAAGAVTATGRRRGRVAVDAGVGGEVAGIGRAGVAVAALVVGCTAIGDWVAAAMLPVAGGGATERGGAGRARGSAMIRLPIADARALAGMEAGIALAGVAGAVGVGAAGAVAAAVPVPALTGAADTALAAACHTGAAIAAVGAPMAGSVATTFHAGWAGIGRGGAGACAVGLADLAGPAAVVAHLVGIVRAGAALAVTDLAGRTCPGTGAGTAVLDLATGVRDVAARAFTGLGTGGRHAAFAGVGVADRALARAADIVAAGIAGAAGAVSIAAGTGGTGRIAVTRPAVDRLLAIVPDRSAHPFAGGGPRLRLALLAASSRWVALALPFALLLVLAFHVLVPLLAPLAPAGGRGLVGLPRCRRQHAEQRQAHEQAQQAAAGAEPGERGHKIIEACRVHD